MSVAGWSRRVETPRASTLPCASASGTSSAGSGLHRARTAASASCRGVMNRKAPAFRPGPRCPEAGAGQSAQGTAARASVVPKRGLEPPRGCPHQTLNLACLPIPPLRHDASEKPRRSNELGNSSQAASSARTGMDTTPRLVLRCLTCRASGDVVKREAVIPQRKILIIDDEEGFRDGVADLLGMEGYDVTVARDAVEAVRVLPEFRPDVILLDLRMPLLDGEGFLRGISGLPIESQVPVVLISAKEDLPAIASRTGAAGYLHKPFEAPQLLSLLEKVLPEPRTRRR